MAQTYTIWFNRSLLKIAHTDKVSAETEALFEKVVRTDEQLHDLLKPDSPIFDGKTNYRILVVTNDATEVLNLFKTKLRLIMAGGGIVFNEHNQMLLIKRNGFWDLAKGKAEPNENIRQTAIREVEEETGVKIETAAEYSFITYHCYIMKGEYCIKETHWFEMEAALNQELLIPQTEEGIETVQWVELNDLPAYHDEAYPMIWSILEGYVGGR